MQEVPDRLPLSTRVSRLLRRVPERLLNDMEWTSQAVEGRGGIEVLLFVPRRPVSFELFFPQQLPIRITSVGYGPDGAEDLREFASRETLAGDERRVVIEPFDLTRTGRVVFGVDTPGFFQARLEVRVVRESEVDLEIVEDAHGLARVGRFSEAIAKLEEYEAFSTENPSVCAWLAEWHRECGELDRASDYVARALRWGSVESCRALYRAIQEDRPRGSAEEVRDLQAAASDWPLASNVGAVVLERTQRHSLGLSGGQLRSTRETLEIRRPAAARMLRSLEFSFPGERSLILDTTLEVLRASGEVEPMSMEHFTVGDDRGSNIFVTVEDRRVGHWILPDLEAGDVIRWAYDLYYRDRTVDGRSQAFVLTSLFHGFFPTLRARSEFVAPDRDPLRFDVRNFDAERDARTVGGSRVDTFVGDRFVPARGTGFAYENEYLNPVIACARDALDWKAVAREIWRTNFGTEAFTEALPEPLAEITRGAQSRSEALESAFYWTRDKLKYAALRSGEARIGAENRAHEIVEAGVGDCKDKSYLMALVCRELEIPHEIIAVSTQSALLIEELPADQFDHVFLRAETPDGWVYLDAANPSATFGPAPAWCQGISALALTDRAEILTIPVDAPQANRMELTEVFDHREHDRLAGRFRFSATGQSARLIDENWKGLSLSFDDERHGAQLSLRRYLPSAVVEELDRWADTSRSSEFGVSGRHRRGTLVRLDRRQRAVCTLTWDVPFLPFSYWSMFHNDRLFAINLPASLTVAVRLEGELRRTLADVSSVESIDNRVGSVAESVTEEPAAITVRRTIELKGRLYRDDDVALVRKTFERMEKALQLVIVFEAGDGAREVPIG